MVLMWSENVSVCDAAHRYGIDRGTVSKIYSKLRTLASRYLNLEPIRLGGPGITCQIDESLFVHKQKYGRGRAPESEAWVFGIADVSITPARIYLELINDRSADTLLSIIERVSRPGTVIHSDKWAAYRNVGSCW